MVALAIWFWYVYLCGGDVVVFFFLSSCRVDMAFCLCFLSRRCALPFCFLFVFWGGGDVAVCLNLSRCGVDVALCLSMSRCGVVGGAS